MLRHESVAYRDATRGGRVAYKNRDGAALLRAALDKKDDPPLRLAAAAGLGDLGSAQDAAALIALLGQPDAALADAARMSLIKLADPKADADLVRALRKRDGDAAYRTRLIGIVTFRKTPEAAQSLLAFLADTDASVRAACAGENGKMVGFIRESTSPYRARTTLIDVNDVMLVEKKMPDEYINEAGNGVTQAFLEWCAPLIGEPLGKLISLR